jgi:phenylalanyl-tRNA synthetase alpha chain
MSKESIKDLIKRLHPLEHECLQTFQEIKKDSLTAHEIDEHSEVLDLNKANRAINWLKEKNILEVESAKKETYFLTKQGETALSEGIPEKKLLKWLLENEEQVKIQDLGNKANLDEKEYKAAFGILKKHKYIDIDKGIIKITNSGIKEAKSNIKSKLEIIIFKINEKRESFLVKEDNKIEIELLRKRGLIERSTSTSVSGSLTEFGKKILVKFSSEKISYVDQLTTDLIKSGNWKNIKLRPYKVDTPVPPYLPGKRHFYWQAIDYVRQVWLSLGFQEMEGTIVQTSFWNFDTLFVPQDHTAREEQDTFFIKNPKSGVADDDIYEEVAQTHLNGGKTGSSGWGGKFDREISESLILRTHTTCLSARTIKTLREKGYPGKYFAVGRCFRNEKIDWKHLAEFDQVEGIVVDPNVTFQDLLGYLDAFFRALGYKEIRFRPGYYPYTEPSVGIEVLHPIKNEWIEVGGSGVFRPEVVVPILGEDIPVLAWGPGIGRIVSERYSKFLVDIRSQYENNLDHLKEAPLWLR